MMKYTLQDIKDYARGLCDKDTARAIREYLVDNPDLIIHVIAEKRQMAMEALNITDDTILPKLQNINVANALPREQRYAFIDRLLGILGIKNEKKSFFSVTADVISGNGSVNNETLTKNSTDMTTNNNISISAETLASLNAKAIEFKNEADPSRSTLHNMIGCLLAAKPELSADEAAQICRKIIKGVTNFSEMYAKLKDTDEAKVNETVYAEMIAKMEGLTPEQQANCMLNFMAFVRAIDAANLSATMSTDGTNIMDEYSRILAEAQPLDGANISPEMLEQMRAQLKDTVETNTISITGVAQVKEMIEAVANGQNAQIAEILNDQICETDLNAYITLAAYIAAQNGEIAIPADVDPTLLGTSIAAGAERQNIINRTLKGLISWEKAAKLLKIVGAALMIGTFLWFAADLFLLVAASTLLITAYLMGTAVPVVIMGVVIGSFFGYKSVKWVYDSVAKPIAEVMNRAYDKAVESILSGNMAEKVKDLFNRFVAYLKQTWATIKATATSALKGPNVIVG